MNEKLRLEEESVHKYIVAWSRVVCGRCSRCTAQAPWHPILISIRTTCYLPQASGMLYSWGFFRPQKYAYLAYLEHRPEIGDLAP